MTVRKSSSLHFAIFSAVFLCLGATGLKAATSLTIGFDTNGNVEGFTTVNVTGARLSVSGGLLSGTASSGDPRLIKQGAAPMVSKLSDETWSTVVMRVRETDETSATVTPFDATGVLAALNDTNSGSGALVSSFLSAVDSGDGFFTITLDISNFTDNDIRYFRFDPIGAPDAGGNKFEVDFVQINAVPEPTTSLLAGCGVLLILHRRRR